MANVPLTEEDMCILVGICDRAEARGLGNAGFRAVASGIYQDRKDAQLMVHHTIRSSAQDVCDAMDIIFVMRPELTMGELERMIEEVL